MIFTMIVPYGRDARWGSFGSVWRCPCHFRFSPDSVAKVPKGHAANFPPKNEISDNRRSMQPQTRCRNRLCVWRPTALSPTLLFDRRAYGSKNLSRMPQKDFCNTIALKADIHRKGRHVSKMPEAVVD